MINLDPITPQPPRHELQRAVSALSAAEIERRKQRIRQILMDERDRLMRERGPLNA